MLIKRTIEYFSDCLQCSLACHKKCLETLAIQCGHKKLQGRLHLFGIDFAHVAKNSPDGIPFIIKKCTSEIESRALSIKVKSVLGGSQWSCLSVFFTLLPCICCCGRIFS